MKINVSIHDEDIQISISKEQKKQIINRVIQYIVDNNCISGEKLHQDDDCIIYAPVCLSDIIDNYITFKTE